MQLKKTEESKQPLDYYKLVQTMSGKESWACPLVAH
ncbi:hypothetical protein ABIB85_002957 [Bradyrhizobium sp. JR1.5]